MRENMVFVCTCTEATLSTRVMTFSKQIRSARQWVRSVYLAEGIHLSIDSEELGELPRRFEAGSSKAKLTWFGALCLAGIGMFVEAYIIITTGQIKTIWHAGYPECFQPGDTMTCPNQIDCCGLFENSPDTCGASDKCSEDGTYKDEFLCSNGTIGGCVFYYEYEWP